MKTIYGVPAFVGPVELRAAARREGLPVERLTLDTMARKLAACTSNASRAVFLFNGDDSVTHYAGAVGRFDWRAVTRRKLPAESPEARRVWRMFHQA